MKKQLVGGLITQDGTISKGKRVKRTLRLRNALIANSFLLEDKKVLDLGCAEGLHSLYMAKNAKEVVGVDHEEHKIEMAKQAAAELGINNVKFVHGDLRDSVLREKLGKFDLIVAWGLLHRISDPIGFLYDIADMGCCLSLEWRTPILPGSQFISLAYHNPLSNYLDPSNLRQTIHSKEKAKKIEAASGFW